MHIPQRPPKYSYFLKKEIIKNRVKPSSSQKDTNTVPFKYRLVHWPIKVQKRKKEKGKNLFLSAINSFTAFRFNSAHS